MQEYLATLPTQPRMLSFGEAAWKFSSRPAGPESLDGNQAYTELHGVHTEFHGGRMMALRAEPALADLGAKRPNNLLRETPCELRATPCTFGALVARGTE
jgi:hypothetical protein